MKDNNSKVGKLHLVSLIIEGHRQSAFVWFQDGLPVLSQKTENKILGYEPPRGTTITLG